MHAHTHTHVSSTRLLWNMVLMWMQLIIKATHPFTCSAQRRGKWIPFLTPLQCWWGSTPYSAVQTSYISPNLIPKLQSCRPLLHTASDQKLELVKAWKLDTCTRELLSFVQFSPKKDEPQLIQFWKACLTHHSNNSHRLHLLVCIGTVAQTLYELRILLKQDSSYQ